MNRPPVLLLQFHSPATWTSMGTVERTMILRRQDHDAVTEWLEAARSRARAEVTKEWHLRHGDLRDLGVISDWRAAQSIEVVNAERGIWELLASGGVEGRCVHG